MIEPVTLIIPTYNRLKGLKALCDSILTHSGDYPYKVLLMVDGGNLPTYKWACSRGYIHLFISCQQRWYVATMNQAVSVCDTELFCYLNDDMLIVQPGWLRNAVKQFSERFADNVGLLKFDDGIQPINGIAVCGLTSKAFVRAIYGSKTPFLWPGYVHYAADEELTEIARRRNCFLPTDIQVQHLHTGTGPIHEESVRRHWDRDTALFAARKAKEFPR